VFLTRVLLSPRNLEKFAIAAVLCSLASSCQPQTHTRATPTPRPPAQALEPLPASDAPLPGGVPQVSRSEEVRGVWVTNVDSSALKSAAALKTVFERAQQWGLNTLYPVVWNKGFTQYPSPVAEREVGAKMDPGLPAEWDMLKQAVELGKSRKIAVIPWFEYGLKVPSSSRLFRQKPDWFTRTRDGKKTRLDHIEFAYLNPAHSSVRAFLKNLMVDLVKRYDVAGLQIDDHFSMWKEFGYDDITRQRFRDKTGKNPPDDYEDKEWTQFRADQITELVVELSAAVRAARNGLVFSVSPNSYPWSLEEHLQDWPAWVRRGAVGEVVLQNYHIAFEQFEAELRKTELVQAKSSLGYAAIGVLAGLSSRKVTAADLQRRITTARKAGYGISFFFYESLMNIIPANEKIEQRTEALEAGFR
jgi:uncharacterized lipoprotein YddW (UPF0748 family)